MGEIRKIRLRINEAINQSKTNGKKVFKKDIAAKLWPNSIESTRQVNMTNLINGTTKNIKTDWIFIICDMCDCKPDFLLGYE